MSFPAATRRRWGIESGDVVGYLDLGEAVVIVKGGIRALRRSLLEGLTEADWQQARKGFGDPSLANE